MTPDGDEMVEATLEVQGVLVDYDLPPVTTKAQIGAKPLWAKQAVKLMGFGAPEFTNAVNGLRDIHRRIGSMYKVKSFEDHALNMAGCTMELNFATRFITPHSQVKGEAPIAFGNFVDPHGLLANAMTGVGSHLEDNQVLYYDCLKDQATGSLVYTPIDPSILRVGQIVQLQVAFGSVPLWGKKGSYRMVSKLRSIAILDRELQDVSDVLS
ncbi:hypothetical protein FA95DRAFT_1499128 [Auriscalpium vulgare]|uniref:Uncharacterized protein n=1 Tax=Auriscalpium vulgare TaxID=40419 RepID=A0ACB8RHL0_9AGAM|nr:hypothetical protein FA95DRAFT_1499128 [Auriscalpium vulgare]